MTISAVLQRDGHTTELQCIDDRNEVEVWVNGELVFRCDITELEYGMCYLFMHVSTLAFLEAVCGLASLPCMHV